MPNIELVLAALLGMSFLLLTLFAISILQGAGRPIGEAGFREAAPWLAKAVPKAPLILILLGRPRLRKDLERELDTLVAGLFGGKDSASERASAMLRVYGESLGLLRRAWQLRSLADPIEKRIAPIEQKLAEEPVSNLRTTNADRIVQMGQMDGYCLKCRTKRTMTNPVRVTLKNGRPATQGVCPVCGTRITRIGKD